MFENEYIRILEYRLKPTASVAPSLAGACLLVPLTAADLRINVGAVRALKEHEVCWSDAGIETVVAVGEAEAWVLVAQFKGPGPSQTPVVAEDNAMIVEPEAYRLIFENHRARVAWVTSAPGDKTAMHSHPGRVFRYLIAPNVIRSFAPDGTVRDVNLAAGAVVWREEPSHHATDNIGDTTGQLVLIEVR